MLTDTTFYLAAAPAILLVGIAKGGFGGSLVFLGVPLMALVIAPPQAAAIMLPILCVMDLFTVWAWRGHWHKRNVAILIPGAIVGIAAGTALFRYLNADALRLFIGVLAIAFAIYHVMRARLRVTEATTPEWGRGSICGAIAGLTSFLAHAGGPPVTVYLLPQRLHPNVYQATTAVLFFAINYLKLVPYAWLGQFSTANLATSAVLFPLAPVGIWLGVWLHKRIPERTFYAIILVALLLTGGKLIKDGLTGLLG